jgi:uncharacterized protein (DUF302 family)
MKKSVLTGVVAFFAGIIITLGLGFTMAPSMMLVEDESKYGFEESVERFEAAVKEAGWKLPAVHDLQATMEKHGKDVKAVKVFELCHPDHAGKILEKDDERVVTSMMPCRVAIYEKSDGKVYVSRMNSSLMASTMGKVIKDVMSEAAAENEKMLATILK